MHRRKELTSKRYMKTFAAMLVTLATMLACVLIGPVRAQAVEYNIGELGWVDKGSSKLTIVSGGQEKPFISGTTVDYGDGINMQLHWNVPNNITVKSGDTFVYDLPENLTFQSGQQYDIINGSGDVVGHYVINGNRMVATYTRGEDAGSNVTAYVTVKGTINSDKTGGNNGGDKTFSYPGYGDVTLKVNPKHEVNASKSAAISTSDPSKWEFVIRVNSVGTNQNVQLNDTMGELMKFNPDSIRICTDADCRQSYGGTWGATSAADNAGFSATIKSMEDGETLYVRYSVTADRATLVAACKKAGDCSQVPGLKNSVEYHSDDNTDHKKTENAIWVTYKDWSVTKGGTQTTIDKSGLNGKKDVPGIQWTINITNGTDTDISGASIKDALGNGLEEPSGDVILTCRKANDWKTQCPTGAPGAFESDPHNNQWSIKVPWLDLVEGTYTLPSGFDSFAITYTTEVTNAPNANSGEHRTYTNDVKVTPKDHPSKGATGTADVGKDVVKLVKKCTSPGSESKNLAWVTSLTALTAMYNVELKDTLDQKGDGSSAGFQQSLVQNSIAVYADEAMTKLIDASVYSITATDHGFTITFKHLDANQTVYVAYQSTVKDGVTAETVYNTAESKHKTATASHTHQGDNLKKMAVNQWYDEYGYGQAANAAGVLRWLLTVHDLPEKAQSVTISDTLPENTMFVPGSVRAVSPNAKTTTLSGVSAKDNGNGTVTFTISPGTAAFKQATTSEGLQIVYDTRVDALKAQEGYHEYTNKAHISVDGNDQTDQSYKLGMNTPKLVSKQGTYNESTAPNVNYTVKINPGAQTLNNGKALTLTDTLGSALDLRMDSILIADSASGKQINGATWSYEPNSKKLVFFIPDKRAVTITYKATVQLKAGETIEGAVGRNVISLEGVDTSKGSDASTVTGTVKTAQGGMTFDSNTLQIYKYIDGDTGRPGANAMFEVQAVNVDLAQCGAADPTTGKKTCFGTVGKSVISNLTTGTTGYSSQVQLNADRIYKVTELVAPGEKADTTESAYEKAKPLYVVFPGNDARSADSKTYNGKYNNLIISDDKNDSGSLTVAVANNATLGNYLWYVNNNHKKKTKVSIAKLDAADINVPVAGASLKLSKWGSSEAPEAWSNWPASMQGVSKDSTGTALIWTTGSTGKQTFDLLPGRYWLEETAAPDGYQTMSPITITVGADGVVTVNGHNVTDKNGAGQIQALDAPKTTNLTVNKVWNDNDDQDGKRRTVTFDLYRKLAGEDDYTKVDGQSRDVNVNVNAGDSAAYWFDLPVVVDGKQAEYKAVEATTIDGYTAQCTDPASMADGSGMVMTCTNTHAPETTSLGVNKKWNDVDNQDRSRPPSITVHLVKNGVKTNQSATLNAANNWRNASAFTNLPVYENGMKITYGVQEDVPSGYTVTTDGVDKNHVITLTNTHHPNNKKVWFSKQSLGGQELAGATMRLTGTLKDTTKTFNAKTWVSGSSQQSFALEPGTYTLTETEAPAGYTKADGIVFRVDTGTDDKLQVRIQQSDGSYVAADDSLITMVDAYQPHRVDIAKNSLTDGITNIAGATMSVTGRTLDGKSVNSITWTTKQGQSQQLDLQPGTYTLSETNPPAGYTKADDITFSVDINGKITVDGRTQTDGTLTMVDKPDTNGIFFSKTAVGGGAELAGAKFNLTGSTFEGKTIDPIPWTSGGTPKRFMLEDGVYTLTETKAPTGYEAVKPLTFTVREGQVYIDGVLQSDRTIRVEDRIATTMVRVRKVWSDSNYGGRPEKVTFHLLRNAKELTDKQYTVEVDSSSSWTHTWTDLPRYDENGERYNYTVDEETTQKLKNGSYRVSITKRPYQDGAEYTVLNVREPDAISAKVTKTWNDNSDNDGKRPHKLTFHVWGTSKQPKDPTDLTRGYEDKTEQMIVQDVNVSGDQQSWVFEGLPKLNIYGNPYAYTITEENVDGYTTSGCAADETGTAGTESKGCVFKPTVSSTDKEQDFQVTNKHTPETTTLNVTKQWDDDSDSDNGRPNSLTIWVLSSIWNGKNDQPLPGWPTPQNNSMCSDPKDTKAKNPVGVSCAVLTQDNAKNAVTTTEASSDGAKETAGSSGSDTTNVASDEWAYAFTNLPKYYKGKEIHYSVTEEAVNGYKPVSLTGGKTVPQQPNQSETGADENNAQTAAADPNTATDESQDSTDGTNATAESWNYQLTNKYTAVKLPSTGGEGNGNTMRVGLIVLLVGTLCLIVALRRKERN